MDTRNKRASAAMVGLPFRGVLPLPDGTISLLDRVFIAYMYVFGSETPSGGGTEGTGTLTGLTGITYIMEVT